MSSLIFVAVAVAWAVYLVPKALEHHDESLRSRTVATFSHTMRVLARREAATSRSTRLVPGAAAAAPVVEVRPAGAPVVEVRPAGAPVVEVRPAGAPVVEVRAKRASKPPVTKTSSAARRRRTVLLAILLLNAGVAVTAGLGHLAWAYQAAPVGLLLAWLVACRLMVRRERSVRRIAPVRPVAPAAVIETGYDVETVDASAEIAVGHLLDDDTQSVPVVAAEAAGSWDPVNVPLPTYVSKPPAARRTVRTIDLDSTGVWSSGRSEIDSALVAEADAAAREAKAAESETRRATGS